MRSLDTNVKSKIYRRHGFRKLFFFSSNHPCPISSDDKIVRRTKTGNELNKGKNAPWASWKVDPKLHSEGHRC